MDKKRQIIKITNEGIHVNGGDCIPFNNTSLPAELFKTFFHKPIFWLATIAVRPGSAGIFLSAKVVDYEPSNRQLFLPKSEIGVIAFVDFEKLDYYAFKDLTKIKPPESCRHLFHNWPNPSLSNSDKKLIQYPILKPIELQNTFSKKVKFSEAKIVEGGIQFEFITPLKLTAVTINIQNPFLKQEYDSIKEYFSKKLGRKTFVANFTIKESDWKIVEIEARSEEIDLINENFIITIRCNQIKSLKNLDRKNSAKNLFTINEIFELDNEITKNVFKNSIDDIIRVITDEYTHRNSKQLEFLSKKHEATDEVIYCTLRPSFGFVFYIKGENHLHYVWELLDSHATYVWSFPGTHYAKEKAYDLINSFINTIYQVGRNPYKKTQRNEAVANEYIFTSIEHDILKTEGEIKFEKWLEDIMVIIVL